MRSHPSHLASAGAGPERYAAVVNPPVGGSMKFKNSQGARPVRKPARQEVSAEDLEFLQYEFEARRFTISAVASPLLPPKSHELKPFRRPGVNVCNLGRFWSG